MGENAGGGGGDFLSSVDALVRVGDVQKEILLVVLLKTAEKIIKLNSIKLN